MYSPTQICTSVPPPVLANANFQGNTPNFNANASAYYHQSNSYIPPFRNHIHNCNESAIPIVCNSNVGYTFNTPLQNNFNPAMFSQPPPGYPNHFIPMSVQFNGHPPCVPTNYRNFPPPPLPPSNHFLHQSNFAQPNTTKQFYTNKSHKFAFISARIKTETKQGFHCCDRNFYSQEQLDKHVSEHCVCRLEGCTFTAHTSLIEKHILMQHRNGLFKRIVKGNSPEEIEKWIAERKKHFPTSSKIAQKQAQKDEMEKRGERYNEIPKRFRNPLKGPPNRSRNDYRNGRRFDSKPRGFNRRRVHSRESNSQGSDDTYKSLPRTRGHRKVAEINEYEFEVRKLPPFKGFNYFLYGSEGDDNNLEDCSSLADDASIFSDDKWDFRNKESEDQGNESYELNVPNSTLIVRSSEKTEQPSSTNKLLTSLDLIKGYTSSEESEQEDNDAHGRNETLLSNVRSEVVTVDENDESEPEECSSKLQVEQRSHQDGEENSKCEASPSGIAPLQENRKRKRKHSNAGAGEKVEEANIKKPRVPQRTRRYRPPSLLERLLSPEIKHERNVILQCVRYVANNNFFGIGQQKS